MLTSALQMFWIQSQIVHKVFGTHGLRRGCLCLRLLFLLFSWHIDNLEVGLQPHHASHLDAKTVQITQISLPESSFSH